MVINIKNLAIILMLMVCSNSYASSMVYGKIEKVTLVLQQHKILVITLTKPLWKKEQIKCPKGFIVLATAQNHIKDNIFKFVSSAYSLSRPIELEIVKNRMANECEIQSISMGKHVGGLQSIRRGEYLFKYGKGKAPPCGSCHGDTAEGISAMKAPALAGIDKNSFVKAMRDFSSGKRKDTIMFMMNNLARALDEGDVEDLSNYFYSLD